MANSSLNYFAIKASDSEMIKFLLAGANQKDAKVKNASEALDVLLNSEQDDEEDGIDFGIICLSDFAKTNDDTEMLYFRLLPSKCDDKIILSFECTTDRKLTKGWLRDAGKLADVEINWYSAEEFGKWRSINGENFSGALVDADGKNSIEMSADDISRTEIEADIFVNDIINGRPHRFVTDVKGHHFVTQTQKYGLSEDEEGKAEYYFDKACDYYSDDKLQDAYEWYLAAAELEHVEAMFTMGVIYEGEFGDVVAKDDKKAFKWYTDAAACGDASSQCALGRFYMKGIGRKIDMAKAIKYFKSAADRSLDDDPNDQACYWLGMIYYVGAGVKKNLRLAYSYFRKAFYLQSGDAIPMLYRCYMNGEGISVNLPKAKELKEIAEEDEMPIDKIENQIEGYEIS